MIGWSELLRREVERWHETIEDVQVTDETAAAWIVELQALRGLIAELRHVADDIESAIATSLDAGETVAAAGRTWARTREIRRRNWDMDGLVRAVLDSRLVDRATGEVVEETPVDRIRHVWRLDGHAVRLGALRARGIADDEFCEIEYGRWRLKDVT